MNSIYSCRNGHVLSDDNVYLLRKPDGRFHKQCRECKRLRRSRHHNKYREKSIEQNAKWKANRIEQNGCSACSSGIRRSNSVYCQWCLDKQKQWRHEVKIECIRRYGGCCVNCGIKYLDFLNIHHKLNNGGTERKIAKDHGGASFYSRLLRLDGIRNDLEVLCFNCNIKTQIKLTRGTRPSRASRCNNKVKQNMLDIYGCRCMCCGLDDIDVLCTDHINNDGSSERHTSTAFYRQIIKEYRSDIHIMCHNCNESKRISGKCCHNEQLL